MFYLHGVISIKTNFPLATWSPSCYEPIVMCYPWFQAAKLNMWYDLMTQKRLGLKYTVYWEKTVTTLLKWPLTWPASINLVTKSVNQRWITDLPGRRGNISSLLSFSPQVDPPTVLLYALWLLFKVVIGLTEVKLPSSGTDINKTLQIIWYT